MASLAAAGAPHPLTCLRKHDCKQDAVGRHAVLGHYLPKVHVQVQHKAEGGCRQVHKQPAKDRVLGGRRLQLRDVRGTFTVEFAWHQGGMQGGGCRRGRKWRQAEGLFAAGERQVII